MIFWTYVMLYGLFRSVIETFRGDFRGSFFMDLLSVSQAIGIAMSVIAAFVLFFLVAGLCVILAAVPFWVSDRLNSATALAPPDSATTPWKRKSA